MSSDASKSPTNGNGNKKRKTVMQDKKIADDEFMAAAIGDVEWLRQSMRANRGAVTFDKNGLAPIHLAAIHGRTDCLRLLVEKFKVDVNLGSTTGWRPAHLCISNQTGKRAYESLAYLLEKGADPSIANDDGITPNHQAASEGHVQCLKALVDAGGKVTGVDARGHTPLDLAKLWGHRKCARILATERWQQEKHFQAQEIKQLEKVKMQQFLEELEDEEKQKAKLAQQSDQAFEEWLDTKGISEKAVAPPNKNKQPTKQPVKKQQQKPADEPKESLHKANSLRKPPGAAAPNTSVPSSIQPQKDVMGMSPDGYFSPERSSAKKEKVQSEEEVTNRSEDEKEEAWYNSTPWNYSTFVPEKEYEPKLPDHFPYDQYTMQPKFPPKRQKSKTTQKQLQLNKSKLRMPQLPKDVIEKRLNPEGFERPVVYNCKHIEDGRKKMHYELEKLPRQEAGLHLVDDLSSMMFKVGLQNLKPLSSNSNVTEDMEYRSAMINLEKTDPGVVNIMKRMHKPTTYPPIKGNYYVLGSHG